MTVGIVRTGVYMPNHFMTAKEIASLSTIPLEVVKNKIGKGHG